eukprot:g65849.t1
MAGLGEMLWVSKKPSLTQAFHLEHINLGSQSPVLQAAERNLRAITVFGLMHRLTEFWELLFVLGCLPFPNALCELPEFLLGTNVGSLEHVTRCKSAL